MQRYDRYSFKAVKTDEGFIVDKPIIGRAGLLTYINADGSRRIEYRPPDEAFKADSLASIRGKPITLGHAAMVNAGNAQNVKILGTVLSGGVQDGNNIRADVSIYTLPTDARELSCGYRLDLDETPGTTPDGQHYDAIQRNIRYNHLAVVLKGRAGVARLNMDGSQEIEDDEGGNKNMAKIRLDNGIEYECAEEVRVEYEKARADKAQLAKNYETMKGKFDAAEAKAAQYKKEAEEAAKTSGEKFDAAVKERVQMLDLASKHQLNKPETMTNKDIKIAIIKKVNGDSINLDGKSDEYISGMFEICKDTAVKLDSAAANRRKTLNDPAKNKRSDSADNGEIDWDYIAGMDKLRNDEANAWMGGRK